MGQQQSLEDQIFKLRFTAKQLKKQSQKQEKQSKKEKLKVKGYIEKENYDVARIYAENAIRSHSQSLNYLRLSSRLDSVVARLQTVQNTQNIMKSMGSIVQGMDVAMQQMDAVKITKIMDKFESQFDDLDVNSSVMNESMQSSTANLISQDAVNGLMMEVADEHGLEVSEKIKSAPNKGLKNLKEDEKEVGDEKEDDIEDRLKKLLN